MVDGLSTGLQENLITILAYDDRNGRTIARMVDPSLFEGEYRVIAERCISFWKRHDEAPKVHTSDLVDEILSDPRNRKSRLYARILRDMHALSEQVNTKYVMDQLSTFTRMQHIKGAILQAAEKFNQKQHTALPDVEQILASVLRSREVNFDPGTRLDEFDKVLDFLSQRADEFTTGISLLDSRGIIPARGEIMLLLAPAKRGKTWWLTNVGAANLRLRKKIVHVSLEVGEEIQAQRYYQNIFSAARRSSESGIYTTRLITDKRGNLDRLKRQRINPEFTFDTPEIRTELETRITGGTRPGMFRNLRVKRFPTGKLTPDQLRAYLDMLEDVEKFIPDMLILDYPRIMKTDAKNLRISIGRNIEEFRAICIERNIAGVGVHQSSKSGMESGMVRASHTSEDFSITGTVDQMLTYSSTDEERRLGLGRIWVDLARNEQDGWGFIVSQSYGTGQMVLDCIPLSQDYFDLLDAEKDAGEADQDED